MRDTIIMIFLFVSLGAFSQNIDSVKTYSSYYLHVRGVNQGSYFQCYNTSDHPKPNTLLNLDKKQSICLTKRLDKLKKLKSKPKEFCVVLMANFYKNGYVRKLAIAKSGIVFYNGDYYKKSKKLYKLLVYG